jgi:selenium metabolism protein YedF
MEDAIDARGLACPAPVLMVKDAVEKKTRENVAVLVDNIAAKENVTRFLESRQFAVTALQEGDTFHISGVHRGGGPAVSQESTGPAGSLKPLEQKIMVLIATDRLGFGDEELGKKLIISFIKTIKEMGKELWRLVLVNNGVKLTIDGSPVLEDLLTYEKNGLTILVCGTCLTHFGLLEAKKVGVTTNMLDIVTAMQLADKVINI